MTKEQIQLLIERGHITPETGRRMVQHYAEGGVVAMPLKAPEPPQPQQPPQPTFEQTLTEMSPIAGAGYGLVKNLIFDQSPRGEFEPGGGGITESMSPIDLVTPTMVAAPLRAVAGGIGKGAIQGAKAIQQGILARGNAGAIELGLGKKAVSELPMDKASRVARAKEMGFNPDETWYHGTKANIEEFSPAELGSSTGAASARKGFFFTRDAETASDYATIAPKESEKTFLRAQKATQAKSVEASERIGKALQEINLSKDSAQMEAVANFKHYKESLAQFEAKLSIDPNNEQAKFMVKDLTRLVKQEKDLALSKGVKPDLIKNLESALDDKLKLTSREQAIFDAKEAAEQAALKNHPEVLKIEREIDEATQKISGKKGPQTETEEYQDALNALEDLEREKEFLLKRLDKQRAQIGDVVYPTNLKMQNPYIHDFKGEPYRDVSYAEILDRAKAGGHDSVILKNTYDPAFLNKKKMIDVGVVFDPSQIRSTFAKFDPSKSGSGNISAAIGGIGILGGASQAQASQGEKAMFTKEQADMMLQRGLITPQTYQRITGAQGYAEGGEVMPAPLPTPAEEIPSTPISVNVGAPVIPEQFATMPAPMPAPTPIPQMTPAGAAGVPLAGQYGPPSPMAQTPPATERAIVPGMPAAPAGFQMPGEASMMKAAGLEAQAAQQIGTAAEKAFEGLQAQMELERKTYQSIQSDIQARLKTLDGELMGGQVNPNRVWSEAGTGAKIGAVLGMLFSGIGAGVTGKENLAVANINKMIDRDIEVQKANIQNKQNLFSKYLTQLGDARQAEAASRLHLVQAAEVQVKQAQAKAATPQAQAAFEKTRAQLEQQKAQYTIELTKMMGNASLYGMGGSEGGIPFGRESFYQASDPELQKRIVPVADKQRSYLARSDQEAAELRKMESAYSKARKMLGDLRQYSSIGARLSPEQRAKADAIVAKLPPLLNELNGYARFTEMEQELLEKTFSAPGILNAMFAPNTKTNALLKDLDTQMQNKRAIMLQGYKPVTTFEPGAK